MALRFRLAYAFLAVVTFASLGAELVSNDRPILLKYHGEWFAPAFRHYHPRLFGLGDAVLMNYRELRLGPDDWALRAPNPWGPFERNARAGLYPSPPDRDNLLGTDDRGRDVLARLLYGFRNSLGFAVVTWIACTAIAVAVGASAGYFGGSIDFLEQRAVELITSVPQLFVLAYLVSILTPSFALLVVVTGGLSWTYLSNYVRSEILRTRRIAFIEAARASGAGAGRVMTWHLLPNSLGSMWTLAPFVIVENISALAALDFLGFGLPPPAASWGELLAQGQTFVSTAWWLAVFPVAALFLSLLSITLVGEHLHRPKV